MGEPSLKMEPKPCLKQEVGLLDRDPPRVRPPSPEAVCPICLDTVTDRAFIETCLHQFCFQCLFSWSRVKPECPLCKQRFGIILHNIRSLADYDEMPVPPPTSPPPTIRPVFNIHVAFQRPRLTYRTNNYDLTWTGGQENGGWLGLPPPPAHQPPVEPLPPAPDIPLGRVPALGVLPTLTRSNMTVASDWRRLREEQAVEFRRNIHRTRQWVRPPTGIQRLRESSPSYYRENPAQMFRLTPWLQRELNVLLDVQFDSTEVCRRILEAITECPIRSTRFHQLMWPYLGHRTEHFCHEFYNFAISPYDMLAYDLHAEYARVDNAEGNDSDIEQMDPIITNEPFADNPSDLRYRGSSQDPIVISDSDDLVPIDSDSSLEIIGTLPPLWQREPSAIVVLDSDSNSSHREEETDCKDLEIVVPQCDSGVDQEQREERESRLRPTSYACYTVDWSSSDSEPQQRRKHRIKRRKRERTRESHRSPSSDEDVSNESTPHPPRRLKSVVKKVKVNGAGCSTWHSSSPAPSDSPQHNLRPRKNRKIISYSNSSSEDE